VRVGNDVPGALEREADTRQPPLLEGPDPDGSSSRACQ
jgi:hypothetical protein